MTLQHTSVSTLALAALLGLSGCASYRVSSNVDLPPSPTRSASGVASAATPPTRTVLISEDAMPSRKYREIGSVEVSVKKATLFHANPTKEQATKALIERANVIGADAVIPVKYDFSIGLMTWGYMDASGTAVKFVD